MAYRDRRENLDAVGAAAVSIFAWESAAPSYPTE
jgi:hypothetical protein